VTAVHHLKCWPHFFDAVVSGQKPFEVRKNDRDFRVGDRIVMYEWHPDDAKEREAEGYTGREVRGDVTYVMDAEIFAGAVGPGYVVLGMDWTHGIYPNGSAGTPANKEGTRE
jgi:hypothetical protein